MGNDIDKDHCVCGVLDYNTGAWWNFDDDTITRYSGYPKNVYDNLSKENEQKRGSFIANGSDRIVTMLYIKNNIKQFRLYTWKRHGILVLKGNFCFIFQYSSIPKCS